MKEFPRKAIFIVAVVGFVGTCQGMAFAQDLNTHYTPHEQTSDERLQNFRPPAAPQPAPEPRTTISPGTIDRGGTVEDHVHSPPYGVTVKHTY